MAAGAKQMPKKVLKFSFFWLLMIYSLPPTPGDTQEMKEGGRFVGGGTGGGRRAGGGCRISGLLRRHAPPQMLNAKYFPVFFCNLIVDHICLIL